jgi:hypothetical protein
MSMGTEPRGAVTGEPWNRAEIDVLVEAYMAMRRAEFLGQRPIKAHVVRDLRQLLPARSERSIDYKLQNVSAVLDENNEIWISGYKPAAHYQRELATATLEALGRGHRMREVAEEYASSPVVAPSRTHLATGDVEVAVPSSTGRPRNPSRVNLTAGPVGALRDFQNRRLGKAGEEWVVDLEREKLGRVGRRDLAEDVIWVSQDRGDGAGYDISSYRPDGSALHIEVKTTNLGVRTPFYITRWELEVSSREHDQYALYRVFGFNRDPKVYVLNGSIEEVARLEPKVFLGIPI